MLYTRFSKWLTSFSKSPKGIATLAVFVSLLIYWLGFELPFLLAALVSVALFIPMPKVFDSWFSRLFISLFLVYGVVQIMALAQMYFYPDGHFALIAGLSFVAVVGLLILFGRPQAEYKIKIFTVRDGGVVLACLFFMLPFLFLVRGDNRLQEVTEMSAVQIADSVVHEANIASYTGIQTIAGDYIVGRYYPSGFHIASSFVERPVFGDIREMNWKPRVALYLGHYLAFGAMLMAAIVYLSFMLVYALGLKLKAFGWLAVAITVGIAASLLHLWLFVTLGFLNYYYICASVLIGACYLLETLPAFRPKDKILQNARQYGWPVFAFLLIAFGASASWPLLVPPILLGALLSMFASGFKDIWKNIGQWLIACLPVAVMAALHLLTVYMQTQFMQANDQLITMGGALHNFNVIFLLVGFGVTVAVIAKNINNLSAKLAVVVLPFVLMTVALLGLHLFLVGEPRYYLIKSAMILEMMFLALLPAYLIYLLSKSGLAEWLKLGLMASGVLLLVLGTTALLPQPLQEVRGLFRDQSGMGKPPFLVSDAASIVQLGSTDKLQNFNMTILHYDPAADRFYAHMETALWAQTLSKPEVDSLARIVGGRSQSCFSKQFVIQAYGTGGPEDQPNLIEAVKECAAAVAEKGQPYYVVTDPGSVPALQRVFGNVITPIY